jgi:hypothetical protein
VTEKLPFSRPFMVTKMSFVLSTAGMRWFLCLIPPLIVTSFFAFSKGAGWNKGFGYAFELFLVFSWLACLASLTRGKLRNFMVVACSLVLGFVPLEALTAKSERVSAAVVQKGFFAYKPGIGWGPAGPGTFPARKSDRQSGRVIFDVTYSIDDTLSRKTESVADGPTVAFFGDSFTFGEGVNDGETMPQAFADLTNHRLRVLNLGFPGYGPHQVLYALETGTFDSTLGSRVRLIVMMTAPWHAERTACKLTYTLRGPSYRLRDDRLEYGGACSDGLGLALREWIQDTALYKAAIDPYQQRIGHDDVELYIRIILAAVDLARKKYGAMTLIPYLPVGDEYLRRSGFTDASIVDRFRAGGATVIDASLSKERAEGAVTDIPGDGHPTAFAHLTRARSILAYVAREMPDLAAQ